MAIGRLETRVAYSTRNRALASNIKAWQMRIFSGFSGRYGGTAIPIRNHTGAPDRCLPASGGMGQLPVRARAINCQRKLVRQYLGDLVDRNMVLGRKLANHVAAEHLLQLVGRDGQVLTGADP